MNKPTVFAGMLAFCPLAVWGQACEGGVYLNPQVIRGEGMRQVAAAAQDLSEFLARTGLSASPVVNVSSLDETVAAVQRPRPPCWVFGNPVVGLGSGYRPGAVNMESIQSAVLLLGDVGAETDPKPVDVAKLPPDEQAKVLAKLKQASCYGMKSGVTTALVKAEQLCGTVVDVAPQAGLGQSYLPTKAAFAWQPDRWVGLITRVQSARTASMEKQVGTHAQLHQARLFVVPTQGSSWGYGIYLHPSVGADTAGKVNARFAAMPEPSSSLARALDVGKTFRFATPSAQEVASMRAQLALQP